MRSAKLDDPALDELELQIRAYATAHGYHLPRVVREAGKSATAAWRPVIDELIRDLQCGRYVGVITPNMDHLGRPQAVALRIRDRIEATSAWLQVLAADDAQFNA